MNFGRQPCQSKFNSRPALSSALRAAALARLPDRRFKDSSRRTVAASLMLLRRMYSMARASGSGALLSVRKMGLACQESGY